MFNEKEREQVNRYLSNQTFTCEIPFFSHDGPKYEVEYRFNVLGEKKMMSVGEYYMYAIVDIEVLDIEERFKGYLKIMGRDFNKERLTNIFFRREYMFNVNITQCINGVLTYLHTGDYPRVNVNNITMSDDLYENIMNKEI
jgi:hypothetical protein